MTDDDDLVPAHIYGDAGPYQSWSDGFTTQGDGFGDRNNHLVPRHLLAAYLEADRARDDAEYALDDWLDNHPKPAPPAHLI